MSTTLRTLAKKFQNYSTLDEWVLFADHLGLDTDPDAPLTSKAIQQLRDHLHEFAVIAANSGPASATAPARTESGHAAAAPSPRAVPAQPSPVSSPQTASAPSFEYGHGRSSPGFETDFPSSYRTAPPSQPHTAPASGGGPSRWRSQGGDEQDARKQFENLIETHFVFLDMLGFVSEGSTVHPAPLLDKTMDTLLQLLEVKNKKLNIPNSAYALVEKWSQEEVQPERRERCVELLRKLVPFYRADKLKIRRTATDMDPMEDMITLCAQHRMDGNLLVITQDEQMASSLLSLNRQKSVETTFRIQAKRSSEVHGMLINTIPPAPKPVFDPVHPAASSAASPVSAADPRPRRGRFRICTSVRPGGDQVLPVTVLPSAGDDVYTTPELSGNIRLEEVLGTGGEGTVYTTNTAYVAKIYRPECCTAYRREKVQWMVDAVDSTGKKLALDGICFPESALYNRCGEFVGYLMPRAKGIPLSNALKKYRLEKEWKRSDLTMCACQVLHKIQFLHNNNILMGDINPKNFLVESPEEVYIVDTDSFQLNDLPCPVAFTYFIAPEILAAQKAGEFSSLSEIMRTRESERFAAAVLLFSILLPGKRPYSQQNGAEDEKENNLNMHFPYPLQDRRGEGVPLGPWRFMWSHLNFEVKKSFHKVFDQEYGKIPGRTGVDAYNTGERLSIKDWIALMQRYTQKLEIMEEKLASNPRAEGVDPESVKIYPSRLKWRDPKNPPVECLGGCGRSMERDKTDKQGRPLVRNGVYLCHECRKKPTGKKLKCDYCGTVYDMTLYQKVYKKVYRPYLCPECLSRAQEIVYDEPCLNSRFGCPNRVQYTLREAADYKYKNPNRPYPKLCKQCLSNR